MAVEGGNWQIFAHMLEASKATGLLSTEVTRIEKLNNGSYLLFSRPTKGHEGDGSSQDAHEHIAVYDQVVLAGPKQFSGITFEPEPQHSPDEIPYVQLHVTLFTSKHKLSPQAFKLPADQQVPQVVLTTLPPGEEHGANPDGVGSPGFFSISTLRPTMDTRDGRENLEYLYKIFSPAPVNSTFLAGILGLAPHGAGEEIGEGDVSWIHRKVWHSYPYEYPRVTFEEMKLDHGLWYTAGIESFISTMETSSLMGMNVAKLISEGWIKR